MLISNRWCALSLNPCMLTYFEEPGGKPVDQIVFSTDDAVDIGQEEFLGKKKDPAEVETQFLFEYFVLLPCTPCFFFLSVKTAFYVEILPNGAVGFKVNLTAHHSR